MDQEIASLERQIDVIQQARATLETDGEMTCAEDWAEKLRIGSLDMVARFTALSSAREMFQQPALPAATFTAAQAQVHEAKPKPKVPRKPADDRDWHTMTPEERAEPIVAKPSRQTRPALRSNIRPAVIRTIRKDRERGMSIKDICDKYDLKHSTVGNIVARRGWFAEVE